MAILAAARLVDYAIQFVLPMVLARVLAPADYGHYMLFWLIVNTSLSVTLLHVPQSLTYLLPQCRSCSERACHIVNTMWFLWGTGLLAAMAVNPWQPLLPPSVLPSGIPAWVLPCFLVLWTAGQMLEVLPGAEERIAWQAGAVLTLSLLRAAFLSALAVLSRDVSVVLGGLLALAGVRLLVLLLYVRRHHAPHWLRPDRKLLASQLRYALPFGVTGALFMLSNQAYLWIVAALFSAAQYANFVIGLYPGGFITLLRESVNLSVQPRLSRLYASGAHDSVIDLFRRANTQTTLALFLAATWFIIYAEEIVAAVFSARYTEGANVLRVFMVSYVASSIETNSLLRIYQGGRFALYLMLLLLGPAMLMSFWGARHFGLPGAALGAVAVSFVGELVKLLFVARQLGRRPWAVVDLGSWLVLAVSALFAAGIGSTARGLMSDELHPIFQATAGGIVIAAAYAGAIAMLRPTLLSPFVTFVRLRVR